MARIPKKYDLRILNDLVAYDLSELNTLVRDHLAVEAAHAHRTIHEDLDHAIQAGLLNDEAVIRLQEYLAIEIHAGARNRKEAA